MPSDPRTRYKPVEPLFSEADRKAIDKAFADFHKKADAFDLANASAKQAVALTLAWVGVGEKLLALAGQVVAQRRTEAETPEDKSRLTKLRTKIAKFQEFADLLKLELPSAS